MSKNLTSSVITKIKHDKLTMRPRWHFIVGAALSAIGITISAALSLLAIHLLRFRLTHPGIGAARKLDFILNNLPWYVPVFALVGLLGGYLLLRRYDFSYRKNFGYVLLAVLIGLVLGSYTLSTIRLDDFLTRRGYFRQIYQDQTDSPMPGGRGPGRMQNRFGRN